LSGPEVIDGESDGHARTVSVLQGDDG